MSPSPTGTNERTPEDGRVRFERLLAFPIEEVWAYSIPDLDMAIERGDLVGLHYSLDRLIPAL